MHDEKIYAQRVLQAGASGYIMKDKTSDVIVEAIRTILDGSIYVSEQITKEIVAKAVKNEYGLSPVDILTNRELAIFTLIGKGKTTREIAATLNLSSKTVGTYKERIKEKLHIDNAVQLVNEATSMGAGY
jgi:DNA-binding NarL/FixJ family response regulator